MRALFAALLLLIALAGSTEAGGILSQGALNSELGTLCSVQNKSNPCISPQQLSDLIASASPGLVVGSISAAGTNQGTATALTGQINDVTTVGTGTPGVILPTAVPGQIQRIWNDGANVMAIYPAVGAAINSLPTNASFLLLNGQFVTMIAISTTLWKVIVNPTLSASLAYVLIPIQGM